MSAPSLIADIERELTASSTKERAVREKAYLKSDLEFIGATVPTVTGAVRRVHRSHPELERHAVLRLAQGLWDREVFELRMAAVGILESYNPVLEPDDLGLVEQMLRESKTWALVDKLAVSVAGLLIEHFPELGAELDRWAGDADFWIRRSALLALLKPLRAGGGDFERFGRYADAMLEEREFFIRKAIGWVLRDTSRRRPGLVAAWVRPRTHRMSGVTLREAIKKLDAAEAADLLAAYREKRPAGGA